MEIADEVVGVGAVGVHEVGFRWWLGRFGARLDDQAVAVSGRDAVLFPLPIGAPSPFGPAEHDEQIRRDRAGLAPIGHRIPEQIASDEDVRIIG
ncbi:MAG: hypothetical protein K9L32_13270 [Chromatiaceae bacterium]|nr:hypothetical protein [Chromatiaceae bacterium]